MEYDKKLHLTAGFIISLVIGSVITPESGLCASIICGILKEVYDYQHQDYHTPDVWDAIYTTVGGLIGFLILITSSFA